MATFWRFVNFNLADPAASTGRPGWVVPWSVDDLARRHWYSAVQAHVTALNLTPADWLWLRQQEHSWWLIVEKQNRHRPAVHFIYSDLFAGPKGDKLRTLVQDQTLLQTLRRAAMGAGFYSRSQRSLFWQAVLTDLRRELGMSWPAVSRLIGQRVTAKPTKPTGNWSDLPASWLTVLTLAGERAAEATAVRIALANWTKPAAWHQTSRTVVVSPDRLNSWLAGWAELHQALTTAKSGRVTETRRAAWQVVKEFYWHEMTRGLGEADLLARGVADERNQIELKRQISQLRRMVEPTTTGQLQRDINILTGRYLKPQAKWHRQVVGRQWARLGGVRLTVPRALELTIEWGSRLLGPKWADWSVVVNEDSASWQVEPRRKQINIPGQPAQWTAAELLPIIAHELTHVWQTEQGQRNTDQSLALWHQATAASRPLAEAGAMRVERSVRHYLGGPDQTRQFYLWGLRARRHGASFGGVMAAVAQGLARQMGRSLKRIPITDRRELVRQSFRRSLRLYRPTLPLEASRRLLNEEQLKYVESALLADDLRHAGLEPLLSVNTIDLTRWPLYRRLNYNVQVIESFPLNELFPIIDQTVNELL